MLSSILIGCGAGTGRPQPIKHQELVVESPTTVVTAAAVTDVETLLYEGQLDLEQGRYQSAAERFELVVNSAQKPKERLRGLLGWGTALDAMGQPRQALAVYGRYEAEAQEGPERDEVRVRQVRIYTYLEDYQRASERAGRVTTEQAPLAQIAIQASLALFALSQDRLEDAELAIGRGRSVIEAEQFDRLAAIPRDVAAVYFALGELRRRKGEAIVFSPMPPDFPSALEERCQWMLDAQSAYSQAMRAEDAHWSAMAGVAVGGLYQELHQELMRMERPVAATEPMKRELFEGALRLRYSILLTKAASMLRATLALREKDRDSSRWVQRADAALIEIEQAVAEEDRILISLPYTRAQLQQALDELARRGAAKRSQK